MSSPSHLLTPRQTLISTETAGQFEIWARLDSAAHGMKKKAVLFRPANSTGSPSNQFMSLSRMRYSWLSLSIITFFWFTRLLTTTNCTLVLGLEALPSRHVVDWSSRLLRLLDNSDILKNRFPLHYHGFFNSTLLMSEIKWECIVLGLIEKRKE